MVFSENQLDRAYGEYSYVPLAVFVFVFDPKTAGGPLWTGPSATKVLYLDLKHFVLLLILANINGCVKGRCSCIPWLSSHKSCNGFWQIIFSNAPTASFLQSSRRKVVGNISAAKWCAQNRYFFAAFHLNEIVMICPSFCVSIYPVQSDKTNSFIKFSFDRH